VLARPSNVEERLIFAGALTTEDGSPSRRWNCICTAAEPN
jgi:hypothetical protein